MIDLANLSASVLMWSDLPFWEIVIKSTLALAMAALTCQVLRNHSAALRHRVWVVGLVASLLVPIASYSFPRLLIPVLPTSATTLVATLDTKQTVSVDDESTDYPDTTQGSFANRVTPKSTEGKNRTNNAAVPATVDRQPETHRVNLFRRLPIQQLLAFTWLLGSALGSTSFLVLLVIQRVRLGRLKTIEDADWVAAVAIAAKQIGLQRHVDTLQSNATSVPAVVGVLAPSLVIPANWRTWSQSQRHCVLLHELAHIKRCDVAAQLLGRLTLLVYWFNPLVWYANSHLRVERELASDDCVLRAGQAASDYAEQLLRTLRTYRPAPFEIGVAMAHSARLDQRVVAILDPQRPRDTAGLRFTFLLSFAAATLVCTVGSMTLTSQAAGPGPQPVAAAIKPSPLWLENYAVEFPGTLPVSVAFSSAGKTLLTGDTSGEIMTLNLAHENPTYRWKTNVGGSHAAVAYSADHTKVYATTKDGSVILDATTGKEQERIKASVSDPIAIAAFPDKTIAEGVLRHQLVLGHPGGYSVESWLDGKLADTRGTIETSTVPKDANPTDEAAMPLAVDPKGRSAIMTGPIDATGESGGVKGSNVVWAYVCGDYQEGSPGNRILVGHTATVVSAAWSKEGGAAATGDADGRVIIWDAKTMKESRRMELGGRIAALAISDDGARIAAYVLGKQGEVYLWDTAKHVEGMKPIHTELSDFAGPQAFASLAFSPDGKHLAGCAIDKKGLTRPGELVGKVRVWELVANPKAQPAPKQSYTKDLPDEHSASFVMLNNESLLMPASKEGAVDLRRISDGLIQARIELGKFIIGGVKMSSDRKWFAIEQRTLGDDVATGTPSQPFDVGIYAAPILFKATIPGCSQLLDIASVDKVAVVRDKQIEVWDATTAKKLKTAPFKYPQIDAAAFSPDGKLLAISARNDLVLWRLEQDTHERIELSRAVGSLAFSPNGKLLAEGPSPGKDIQIRDLESKKVELTLANDASREMDIAQLTFTQGGRVLVACDDISLDKKMLLPHRIYIWDTVDGSLAHQIEVPAGLPKSCEVSPNGRHLVVAIEDSEGMKLRGWRLDGRERTISDDAAEPPAVPAPNPPDKAAEKPATKSTTVRGKVVDDATGEPIGKLIIQGGKFEPADPKNVTWGYSEGRSSARDGSFSTTIQWGEGWTARILADGYIPQPVITLAPPSDKDEVDVLIRLKQGPRVRGVVLDHAGRPMKDAAVFAIGPTGLNLAGGNSADNESQGVRTDSEGRFEIMAGAATSLAISQAAFDAWPAVIPTKGDVTVRLPEPARINLELNIDGADKESEIFYQLLTQDRPEFKGLRIEREVQMANPSTLSLPALPPGRYQLSRNVMTNLGEIGFGSMLDRQFFELKAGETKTIDFVREKGARVRGKVTWPTNVELMGTVISVQSEKAQKGPFDEHEWRTTYASQAAAKDGEFHTERILPGKYILVAEAYLPLTPEQKMRSGVISPSLRAQVEIEVPMIGELTVGDLALKAAQAGE
jgi:beta-lactamase regulating signal transducer with metallopeptidase domain/WD40 repeat protein